MQPNEQNILTQLVKAREAVRRKYNLLKRNKEYIEKVVGETFKPIIDPLDKLVLDKTKESNVVVEKTKKRKDIYDDYDNSENEDECPTK